YDKGDYDIWMREFDATGKTTSAQPVANSPQYEARPALTFDGENHLWICWEHSGATWGKDWGALVKDKGIGLYRDRQIGLRVLADGKGKAPETAPSSALPGATKRRGPANLPVRRPEPLSTTRRAGEEAEVEGAITYNNLGRLIADHDGRVWLFARC